MDIQRVSTRADPPVYGYRLWTYSKCQQEPTLQGRDTVCGHTVSVNKSRPTRAGIPSVDIQQVSTRADPPGQGYRLWTYSKRQQEQTHQGRDTVCGHTASVNKSRPTRAGIPSVDMQQVSTRSDPPVYGYRLWTYSKYQQEQTLQGRDTVCGHTTSVNKSRPTRAGIPSVDIQQVSTRADPPGQGYRLWTYSKCQQEQTHQGRDTVCGHTASVNKSRPTRAGIPSVDIQQVSTRADPPGQGYCLWTYSKCQQEQTHQGRDTVCGHTASVNKSRPTRAGIPSVDIQQVSTRADPPGQGYRLWTCSKCQQEQTLQGRDTVCGHTASVNKSRPTRAGILSVDMQQVSTRSDPPVYGYRLWTYSKCQQEQTHQGRDTVCGHTASVNKSRPTRAGIPSVDIQQVSTRADPPGQGYCLWTYSKCQQEQTHQGRDTVCGHTASVNKSRPTRAGIPSVDIQQVSTRADPPGQGYRLWTYSKCQQEQTHQGRDTICGHTTSVNKIRPTSVRIPSVDIQQVSTRADPPG